MCNASGGKVSGFHPQRHLHYASHNFSVGRANGRTDGIKEKVDGIDQHEIEMRLYSTSTLARRCISAIFILWFLYIQFWISSFVGFILLNNNYWITQLLFTFRIISDDEMIIAGRRMRSSSLQIESLAFGHRVRWGASRSRRFIVASPLPGGGENLTGLRQGFHRPVLRLHQKVITGHDALSLHFHSHSISFFFLLPPWQSPHTLKRHTRGGWAGGPSATTTAVANDVNRPPPQQIISCF